MINEYLDKDYAIPLKHYMNMSEVDRAVECTYVQPWLFSSFIEENNDLYNGLDVPVSYVGATVGTYAGSGAIATAYFIK